MYHKMDKSLYFRKFACIFLVILITLMLADGAFHMTKLRRAYGSDVISITCARNALDRSILATESKGTDTCTNLDWNWAASPIYQPGFTYYKKTHVIEKYNEPLVLGGKMALPIEFYPGSYIDMYIEFTTDTFTFAFIYLVDNLNSIFDLYDYVDETLMISLEIRPSEDKVINKVWSNGWTNHASVSPYPFPAGTTTKITFRALTDELQILFDDEEFDRYNHYVPPQSARMLHFSNFVGTLLHKIEFSGAQ